MGLRMSFVMMLWGLAFIGYAMALNIGSSIYQLAFKGDQVANGYYATTFHAQNMSTLYGCLAWATSK
jgi:hypothetical protein